MFKKKSDSKKDLISVIFGVIGMIIFLFTLKKAITDLIYTIRKYIALKKLKTMVKPKILHNMTIDMLDDTLSELSEEERKDYISKIMSILKKKGYDESSKGRTESE